MVETKKIAETQIVAETYRMAIFSHHENATIVIS